MVKVLRHDDAPYRVRFDDGDREWFAIEDIRLIACRALTEALPQVDAAVWGQWRPNNWYHGRVVRCCPIGYEIQFDDGDAIALPAELLAIDQPPLPAALAVGTRVVVHWERGKFFPGTITEVRA
jgi:hypothetical protein